jgi:drug/metabolite transporter (DMT)-like permease
MASFWVAVIVRILANPVSNAVQKWLTNRGVEPPVVILSAHLLLTVVCLPLAWCGRVADVPIFIGNLSTAVALAVACNTILVYAVRLDDLSILGPINAFKSVVSLVPAWLLLGERLTIAELAGLVLIVVGSFGLTDRRRDAARSAGWGNLFLRRGVQLRIAALVLSATEAVFLKRALAVADPTTTFAWWSIAGFGIAAVMVAGLLTSATRREQTLRCGENLGSIVLLATTTGLMQGATLFVLSTEPVAAALALFQLSSVLSVWLGHRLFAEPHVWRRLAGSLVMAAGAALIACSR